MGDRVGVMSAGRLEQIAPRRSSTTARGRAFVAEFVGLTNRIDGDGPGRRRRASSGPRVPLLEGSVAVRARCTALVRPENVRLAAADGRHRARRRGELPRIACRAQVELPDGTLVGRPDVRRRRHRARAGHRGQRRVVPAPSSPSQDCDARPGPAGGSRGSAKPPGRSTSSTRPMCSSSAAGPGGLSAALAAARAGARTTLLDRYGCFGGNMTQVGVESIGWYRHEETVEADGIGREFEERAAAMGAANPESQSLTMGIDGERFKYVADVLVAEAGITPMLHRLAVRADRRGRRHPRRHHREQVRPRGHPREARRRRHRRRRHRGPGRARRSTRRRARRCSRRP